jgi:hypothetical protein
MQSEGQHDLHHGPPSNSTSQPETSSYLSAGPSSRMLPLSKGSTTWMSEARRLCNFKHHRDPPTSRQAQEGGAKDGCNNHADFTACFMARTARTQQVIARKQRPPGIGCLEHSQPTTSESSRTHTTTTTTNPTTTTTSNIYPTTHITTIRKYKLFHPRLRLRITRTHTTKITPSTKVGRLRRAAVSRSHPHDHRRVQRRLRNEAA